MNLAPGWSVGFALNLNQEGPLSEHQFRSRTTARSRSLTTSDERLTSTRTTTADYRTSGTITVPPSDYTPSFQVPLPAESGNIPSFVSTATSSRRRQRLLESEYIENNRYEDVSGWNGTIGLRWAAPQKASAGIAVDLPWSADTRQYRKIQTTETLRDPASGRVLDTRSETNTKRQDLRMDFPLALSMGLAYRLTTDWLVSMDSRFTRWSDFRFGQDPSSTALADTWAYGLGSEYILRRGGNEIPLRVGLLWEQRPAPGGTDNYRGFAIGSGFRPGHTQSAFIVDAAYQLLVADDLASLVPSQPGLRSDTHQHSAWLTLLWHY